MTYAPPSVGAAGLSIPLYSDILEYYISGMKSIYGQDIYLGNDTADYQILAILALAANDCMSCCQIAYNSFGALSTSGAAQDQLYKINGIARKSPTYSVCSIQITGTAGFTISNGKASDINNYIWDLPTTVIFGTDGTATVTATCETIGAIAALPGDINTIYTPTYGWISVTNTESAIQGQPVESDAQFRIRQTISTGIASISPVNSVEAAVAALSGITRYVVFENPTGSAETDPNGLGLPPHSITVVTEGGDATQIATAIWEKKTEGTLSNGSTTINITDKFNNITPIHFDILQYNQIYVTVEIHKLTGYTDATTTEIKTVIANYINSLGIGEIVYISGIQSIAMTGNTEIIKPVFAVRTVIAGFSSGGQSTGDMAIAFNFSAQTNASNITINFVA